MKKYSSKDIGIQLLLQKYKKVFRIPENIDYYDEKDYQTAERKFVRYALRNGNIDLHIESKSS
jgi:hypothetical protein